MLMEKTSTKPKNATPPASSTPARSVATPPDTAYKMCKKIAQLTKVIYFLNTKSEDHATELKSLTDVYEHEIGCITKDACIEIESLKINCKAQHIELMARENIIQSNINQISQQELLTQASQATQSELEERIVILEVGDGQKERKLQEFENQKDELTSLVNATRTSSQTQLDTMDDALRSLSTQASEELSKVKTTFEAQIAELKQENTKVVQQLVEEKTGIADNLRVTVAAMKKRHDDDSKYFQHESKRLKQTINELEKNYLDNSKAIESKYSIALEIEERKSMEKAGTIHFLESEITRKTEEIEISKSSTIGKIAECNALTKSLTQQGDKYVKLEHIYYDKLAALTRSETQIISLQGKLDQQINDFNNLDKQHTKLVFDYGCLMTELQELKREHQTLLQTNTALNEIIRILAVEKEDLIKECAVHVKNINLLHEQIQALKEAHAQELATCLLNLETDLTIKHELEKTIILADLSAEYEARIAEKVLELDDCQNAMIALRFEKDAIVESMSKEFDGMKLHLERKISIAATEQDELWLKNGSLNDKLDKSLIDATKMKVIVEQLHAQAEQTELDRSHLYQKMVNIEEQVRHEMDKQNKQDTVALQAQWATDLDNALICERKEGSDRNELDIKRTIDTMTKTKNEELFEQSNSFNNQLLKLSEERNEIEMTLQKLDFLYNDLKTETKIIKEKHQILLEQQKAIDREEALKELKKLELALNGQMTQVRVQAAIAQNNADKKHARETLELNALHIDHTIAVRLEAENVAAAAKKVLDIEKTIEIENLNLAHRFDIQEASVSNASALAQQEQELTQTFTNLIAESDAKYAADIKANNSELINIQAQRSELQSIYEQNLAQLEILKSTIEENKLNLAAKAIELDLLQISAQESLKKLDYSWTERMRKEIDDINCTNLADSQMMLVDFEQGQRFLKTEISAFKQKDAEVKYTNREPRDADLQTISNLGDSLQRAKEKSDGQKEELKFFRLELTNREANFNKMFNKTPNVGLLQSSKAFRNDTGSNIGNGRLPPLVAQSPHMA